MHFPAKASSLSSTSCRQEALAESGSDFPEKRCGDPYCRKGLYCSFVCKFCSMDFCSDHFRPEDHKCVAGKTEDGWVHPLDKRVATCADCSAVVSEANTLPKVPPGHPMLASYKVLAAAISDTREQILSDVREKLNDHAEKRANLHSFWSTMDSLDESDLVNYDKREKLNSLQQERSSMLLSLHLSTACTGARQRTQAAPSLRCSMKKCKNKGFMIQQCKKCKTSFCLAHRLPEVHECKC